jgi:chromosome segregation protein
MHIQELVLDNFKSFGRKTRIPFYGDFTTISGPNGSGKSNIIDAVLFALGLARTSGIRAEKLTDLIYNPGHDDDASGFAGEREAEVEVVLDNTDRTLHRPQVVSAAGTDKIGDVDEISIKRRVKQTDADTYYSYYYINGRSVNLTDIRDLLSQAGVTPEGYNVVMQGDVTEIITKTPLRRREILDEIAGVAAFDAKKQDAFGELDIVQERIDEADLRIEEKHGRLEQLEDERETALQYQELRDTKEEYEGYLKAAELENKREELTQTRAAIENHENELRELQDALDSRQGKVTRLEEDFADLNAEIERKGEDEQLAIKREIEEVKGKIGRFEDRIEAHEEKISEAESKRRQAFIQVDRKGETVDEKEAAMRDVKIRKADLKAELQEHQSALETVEVEIESVDTEYEEVRDALETHREELSELKDVRNDLQREQDRLLDEARRRTNDRREKSAAIEDAQNEIPDIEAEIADLASELEKAEQNRTTITEVVEDLKVEKRTLQERLDELEDAVSAKQQEYAELEAHAGEDGDQSYGRSVTSVLNAGIDGVHGTVGQLGGVNAEFATACETAAGGRLAHVVVNDDGAGQRGIEHLKSRNAGRATFLPITKMHSRSLPSLPSGAGVIDFAYNLVDFDPQYAEVFSYVLGDTVVVEDMQTARDLMGNVRIVTLDGDLVEKSGAMTGGSSSGSRYSFSKSGKGRLERVAERIHQLEDERGEIRDELREVEGRLDNARDRQTDATDKVREVESSVERKETAKAERRQRIKNLEEELAAIESERDEVSDRMEKLEADIGEQKTAISACQDAIDARKAELKESDIPDLTERAETLRAEMSEITDEMDDLDATLNELSLEKQYAQDAIDELHDTIETAQNRKVAAEKDIETFEAEIETHEATLDDKRAEVDELEDELAELKDEREELKTELSEAREARDEWASKVRDIKEDLTALRDTVERLEWEVDELASQVDEYDADEIPDLQYVKGQITKLDNRMEALEPVNMLAIDEYDRVAEELDDIQEKKDTLTTEAAQIKERIEQFEQRKKATFMEAYEAIDEKFQDIFARLSNGQGELHLEDEDDPFDGGLTMKAQPADKPVQRLDAMSGGEKSLTALAFIFAIQRYNPAPFYALDEVDAFLDAANAEMVGEMVDELATDAQFVVVSHRSALLERSERAIGVTMQGDNVSAVTGIDLSQVGVVADD